MRSLARLSFAVLTALVMSVCFSATHTAYAQGIGTSGIIISEFRFDGPNGTTDEFVEITNNSGTPKTIVSSDAANLKGFSVVGLVAGNLVKICTIPFNTLLQPGQHFLCARTPGFELAGYSGTPNDNIANYPLLAPGANLQSDGGVALFSSEDVEFNGDGTWFSATGPAFREDAVGFKKLNSATFDNVLAPAVREGVGLNPIGPQDPTNRGAGQVREYSFVRKHNNTLASGGTYVDTNINGPVGTGDWVLVSNIGDATTSQATLDGTAAAGPQRLNGSDFDPSPAGNPAFEAATTPTFGAPGPQSTTSPIERNFSGTSAGFSRSLFDTGSAANVSPNIERNSTIVCGGSRGDLILRATFKNTTTLTQNNLKVRYIQLATIGNSLAPILTALDSTAGTRVLFVQSGRDTTAVGPPLPNDPAPSGDGITNAEAAGGPGLKTVRGTYVEAVDKTPMVLGVGTGSAQNFRQVNPTLTDGPLGPCRLGGLNSAVVATSPGSSPALPASLVNNGSISLEGRFGVLRGGSTTLVTIIESN